MTYQLGLLRHYFQQNATYYTTIKHTHNIYKYSTSCDNNTKNTGSCTTIYSYLLQVVDAVQEEALPPAQDLSHIARR